MSMIRRLNLEGKWLYHRNICFQLVLTVCRMDVCGRNPNRTAPVNEDTPRQADVPLCSRTNGWTWPPHPFQLLAWLLYLYFAITGFGVFVPLLPTHWIPAGYIVSSLCSFHWWSVTGRCLLLHLNFKVEKKRSLGFCANIFLKSEPFFSF